MPLLQPQPCLGYACNIIVTTNNIILHTFIIIIPENTPRTLSAAAIPHSVPQNTRPSENANIEHSERLKRIQLLIEQDQSYHSKRMEVLEVQKQYWEEKAKTEKAIQAYWQDKTRKLQSRMDGSSSPDH